jgi:hypothetical protein
MRLSRALLWTLALLILATFHAPAIADKDKDGPPPKPSELKVLDRFLGTWDLELVSKVTEVNPKETKSTSTATFEWILDGRFMRVTGKTLTPEKIESLQMMSYNPAGKQFYGWFFDSQGSVNEVAGQWDEDTKTMTWQAPVEENVTMTNRLRFTDKNTIVWTMITKDNNNKIYVDVRGKMTRKKE